jgi:hypothetical protein
MKHPQHAESPPSTTPPMSQARHSTAQHPCLKPPDPAASPTHAARPPGVLRAPGSRSGSGPDPPPPWCSHSCGPDSTVKNDIIELQSLPGSKLCTLLPLGVMISANQADPDSNAALVRLRLMRHGCTIRQRAGKIRQLLVQQAACEILIPAGAKDKDSDQVQQQAEPFRQPVLLPGVYHTTQAQGVTLHKPDARTTLRSPHRCTGRFEVDMFKCGCYVSGCDSVLPIAVRHKPGNIELLSADSTLECHPAFHCWVAPKTSACIQQLHAF